jgi:hypothetical protein
VRSEQECISAQRSLTAKVDSPLGPSYNRLHRGQQHLGVHVFCCAEADIHVNPRPRGEYENAYRRRLGGGF